ncbi:hypothetical protein M758_UG147200 [Ceratodon purpureus]|nr:hypothetical protein M758_UG147200 [Ceratodon purpureus]
MSVMFTLEYIHSMELTKRRTYREKKKKLACTSKNDPDLCFTLLKFKLSVRSTNPGTTKIHHRRNEAQSRVTSSNLVNIVS